MTWLGDIGGWLLAVSYDNPLALAVLGAAGLAAMALSARRWHWADRVRRHPVAASAGAVVALLVIAPVAWYLVSPVFIRTELVEPPAAAFASVPPAVAPRTLEPARSAEVLPTASPTPAAPTPIPWVPGASRSGSFAGTDDFHFGRGTATIRETAPGEWTIRLEDFSVRNGPDLYVYLSPARKGYADGALEVAKLKATDGSFNVRLPAGADPSRHRSVLIWCKQFSHLFAYATLES